MIERINLLDVKKLRTYFYSKNCVVRAVDGVNIQIAEKEVLGIVGESGCGKSMTALSIMRLISCPPGKIQAERLFFNDKNLLTSKESEMRKIRGNDIAMIFQDPLTSLNPVYTIGKQIGEVISLHQGFNKSDTLDKAIEMLRLVKIPLPEQRIGEYPHQLSGGMRQRIMIAIALCCTPSLLIADEPTTALDVTIQAQILDLLKELKHKTGAAIMLITHDLGVIADMADRVSVMYGGKIVEEAEVHDMFSNPLHPYSKGLLASIPRLDRANGKLQFIKGNVPELSNAPKGCKFYPRCDSVRNLCRKKEPELICIGEKRYVRCWLYN